MRLAENCHPYILIVGFKVLVIATFSEMQCQGRLNEL